MRHRAVAGCSKERHTSLHHTWFDLRERLKEANIIRKADLQTIARFLRQVIPTNSIAEPDDIKLGAISLPRER
jgi:D-mannonate dehydratase